MTQPHGWRIFDIGSTSIDMNVFLPTNGSICITKNISLIIIAVSVYIVSDFISVKTEITITVKPVYIIIKTKLNCW